LPQEQNEQEEEREALKTLAKTESYQQKLSSFLSKASFWENLNLRHVYVFFITIILLSVAVLCYETSFMDTAMIIGEHLQPSELGTFSVTYTIFYHFLFIIAGLTFS